MSHIIIYSSEDFNPINPYLTNYMEIESRHQSLIYTKFIDGPLDGEELAVVL